MWSTVNMSKEDRATDIGNVHKQFGKDSACVFGDILADRQTETQTDRHTHHKQYFATAPAGDVR